MDRTRRQLMLAAGLGLAVAGTVRAETGMQQQSAERRDIVTPQGQRRRMRFWLALPAGYGLDARQRWPLVFFLHGSGERGGDLQQVLAHGPARRVAAGELQLPFVLVSPQLDEGCVWNPHELQALADSLGRALAVEMNRLSVTGLSLGGHGCWHWACAYPHQIAAIAPVCGFGDPLKACAMRDVPVRAYHGEADDLVPLAAQQAMVDALRRCGGSADLTVYPGLGHAAWDPAYADAGLYAWLAERRLRERASTTAGGSAA